MNQSGKLIIMEEASLPEDSCFWRLRPMKMPRFLKIYLTPKIGKTYV